jgi:hypothetical protein
MPLGPNPTDNASKIARQKCRTHTKRTVFPHYNTKLSKGICFLKCLIDNVYDFKIKQSLQYKQRRISYV